jgi:transcription elongation factor GreA
MVMKKEYLSKEKYQELEQELKALKTVARREVAEQLEYAKSMGDLSENAEYHEARDKQADIEDRIRTIDYILKTAVITGKPKAGIVGIGSAIVLRKDGGKDESFTLVGSEEADLLAGKISHESPLGSALLGKKEGDGVVVRSPRGEIKYKIIKIV